jgi:hypothetical protein
MRDEATYSRDFHINNQFLLLYHVSSIRSSPIHGSTPQKRGPRGDGFKVVYDLDHSSESPAEL